jgi:hypothetical protein
MLVGDKNYSTSLARQYWLKTGFQDDDTHYITFSTFDVCYITKANDTNSSDTYLCTSPEYSYPFDPYSAWSLVLDDSQIPSCFKDHTTLYESGSRAIFPLFLFTTILFALCLVIGVITMGAWGLFRWLFFLTIFTFIFSLAASADATAVFEYAQNCVNSNSDKGLTADMDRTALGLAWTATVLAFITLCVSSYNFYTNRDVGPYESGTKRYAFNEAMNELGRRLNPNFYRGGDDLAAWPELNDMDDRKEDQYVNLPLEGNNEPPEEPRPAPAPPTPEQELPDYYYYNGQYYDDADEDGNPVNYNNRFRRYNEPEADPDAEAKVAKEEAKKVHVPKNALAGYNNGYTGDINNLGTYVAPTRKSMPDPYSEDIYQEYYGSTELARGSHNKMHTVSPDTVTDDSVPRAPASDPHLPEPQYDSHQPNSIHTRRYYGPQAVPPDAYGRVSMYNMLAQSRHYEDYD